MKNYRTLCKVTAILMSWPNSDVGTAVAIGRGFYRVRWHQWDLALHFSGVRSSLSAVQMLAFQITARCSGISSCSHLPEGLLWNLSQTKPCKSTPMLETETIFSYSTFLERIHSSCDFTYVAFCGTRGFWKQFLTYKDDPDFSEGFCFWLVWPNRYLFPVILICIMVVFSNGCHWFRCCANRTHRENPCLGNLFFILAKGRNQYTLYCLIDFTRFIKKKKKKTFLLCQ